MSVIGSNILAGSSGQGGYFLTNSLRFRSSASAYLNRTPASAGNRRTFTYSVWLKRGVLDASYNKYFFSARPSSSVRDGMYFGTNQTLSVFANDGSSALLTTTQVFRDVSAWYHIVVAVDTTQATASNRVKIYVNGSQVTAFGTATYPTQNYDWAFNNSVIHTISDDAANVPTGLYHFDGYMAEINSIDGQALTPSSFGQTSATTGVWIPKKYTGTYGTNGFYLDFKDTSSTTALGYDAAGSNDWTVNNISLTTGSTYDSMTDVPTLTSATAANYCVWNPNWKDSTQTVSNGNLKVEAASNSNGLTLGTIAVSSGKWYWEATIGAAASMWAVGICNPAISSPNYSSLTSGNSYAWNNSSQKYNGQSASSYGATYTTGDVLGVALDLDGGTITFYKNNTSQGTAFTGITGTFTPMVLINASSDASTNFGQQPFAYTPPTGYVALNTFNLPTPTIGATASTQANDYFNVVTYTGNGSVGRAVTGVGFKPDFTWIKGRSDADYNYLVDIIRTYPNRLFSNLTDAASTESNTVTSSDSDGFTVGSDAGVNRNNSTYVAWNWKANGSGSTNTAGSITSTVSANTSAGFSIATLTTQSSGTGTFGHGLGVAPSMVICKYTSTTSNWFTWHTSIAGTDYLTLNTTSATTNNSAIFSAAPTSTVVNLGTAWSGSGQIVSYCFAQIAGYSAFGSYTGNGSTDGTFVHLGFRPKFVMIKSTIETSNWFIYDTARNTYNAIDTTLFPSASNADYVDSTYAIDVVSNGFKIRGTGQYGGYNNNGNAYVYACFAETPFKYSLAR